VTRDEENKTGSDAFKRTMTFGRKRRDPKERERRVRRTCSCYTTRCQELERYQPTDPIMVLLVLLFLLQFFVPFPNTCNAPHRSSTSVHPNLSVQGRHLLVLPLLLLRLVLPRPLPVKVLGSVFGSEVGGGFDLVGEGGGLGNDAERSPSELTLAAPRPSG
jgi:hypothetical protein